MLLMQGPTSAAAPPVRTMVGVLVKCSASAVSALLDSLEMSVIKVTDRVECVRVSVCLCEFLPLHLFVCVCA